MHVLPNVFVCANICLSVLYICEYSQSIVSSVFNYGFIMFSSQMLSHIYHTVVIKNKKIKKKLGNCLFGNYISRLLYINRPSFLPHMDKRE